MSESPFNELETRSRRTGIPQSRHGARSDLVAAPRPAAAEPAAAPTTALPKAVSVPKGAPARAAATSPAVVDALVKTTIHLGEADDALLNLISYTGKEATPKVEASRSAVVRLALRRLAETMTPGQIIDELRTSSVATGVAGRPRLR